MANLTIYYSVSNGGDGSAYPKFFKTLEMASWHQDTFEMDSWGEECVGSLSINGDNIEVPNADSAESFFLRNLQFLGNKGYTIFDTALKYIPVVVKVEPNEKNPIQKVLTAETGLKVTTFNTSLHTKEDYNKFIGSLWKKYKENSL